MLGLEWCLCMGWKKLGVKEGVGFGGVWGPINAFGNGPLDPFGWVSMVPQNLADTESMTEIRPPPTPKVGVGHPLSQITKH